MQEIELDNKEGFHEISYPSLTPQSLKDSSTKSHQLALQVAKPVIAEDNSISSLGAKSP